MEIVENNTFIDYKDILLFDKTIKDTLVVARVSYSRFKIILSNYVTLNCVGMIVDGLADKYEDYTISQINDRGNAYKIIKINSKEEEEKDSGTCGCEEKRPKVQGQDKCYYCQRVEKDYTTSIYTEEELKKRKRNVRL